MRHDYYLHRSGGRVFDYFGGIGTPFKVSCLRAWLYKIMGYRMTRVRRGASVLQVMTRATLLGGAGRHSYKMKEERRLCREQSN